MGQSGTNQLEDNPRAVETNLLQAVIRLDTEIDNYTQYKEEASNKLWQTGLKKHTQRAHALERLREVVLEEMVKNGDVDAVRVVEIDDKPFYSLSIGTHTFHTPIETFDGPIPEKEPPSEHVSEEILGADPSVDMTEEEALKFLSTQFESPNYYINDPFGDPDQDNPFVGWSYLPGAVKWGDEVPDWLLEKHSGLEEFIFDVGDIFETVKGECEIMNRYYAYFTPWMRQSPIKPIPVYDVWREGEKEEAVRAGCIIDDWCIIADSISDPVPDVNGKFGEIAGSVHRNIDGGSTAFNVGDILEIESEKTTPNEETNVEYYRLDAVYVSGVSLIGDYTALSDTDEVFAQSIQEIEDDVVGVYNSVPV
jgi:hypothetical protein